jgi:beta-lactamase superfamily II metal-dependent hydrolase
MAASTIFSLEAIFAKKGDSLILSYGPAEAPKLILIDGGPSGVFNAFLRPRLDQLRDERSLEEEDPLAFELVMVSHIDDDHINGILALFEQNVEAMRLKKPPPYETRTLWHNSFDDLLGGVSPAQVAEAAAAANSGSTPALPGLSEESLAVIASTPQGKALRELARKLKLRVNDKFGELVQSPAKAIAMGEGLTFTVVGPDKDRIEALREQWQKDLEALKKKKKSAAEIASFTDDSPYNLASICVLATMKKRSMLLTGDARGDFVLEGLERAGLLKKKGTMHVDLLKVPHHGSNRNVELSFFERITADHYVVSGDGEHGNPDADTLDMITDARGKDDYTIHFTFRSDAHKTEKNAKRKKALASIENWRATRKKANCTAVFQQKGTPSVRVDLLA